MGYVSGFRFKIISTQDLAAPGVLNAHLTSGFVWMRRRARTFDQDMRRPTLGFTVELSVGYMPYAIRLDSAKARRVIKRVGYFTPGLIL
jgi:hypothetical protein